MTQRKNILFFGASKGRLLADQNAREYILLFQQILRENHVRFINTDGISFNQYMSTAVTLYALSHGIAEKDIHTYYPYIHTDYLRLMNCPPIQFAQDRVNAILNSETIDLAICIGGTGHPYIDLLHYCQHKNIPLLGIPQYEGIGREQYRRTQDKMGQNGFFAKEVKKHEGVFRNMHSELIRDIHALPKLVKLCLDESE